MKVLFRYPSIMIQPCLCITPESFYTIETARKLLRDVGETDRDLHSQYESDYIDHIKIAERSFHKSITAIRIAMNSLSEIINGVEHDWIIREILMQHKNMLHAHIGLLLKEKKKL